MTYLTQRISQKRILLSRFLSLALLSLALIALQPSAVQAQWAGPTSNNLTTTNNVGIGTANPATKLEVAGEIRSTDSSVVGFFVASAGGANSYLGSRSNHGLRFRTNDIDRLAIESGGNVGIGTTTPIDKLQVVGQVRSSGPIGGFVMEPRDDSGAHWVWYNATGDAAQLFNSGVGNVMTIVNSGNVGIGTIAPTVKLHVAGDGKFTGNLIVDGNIAAKYQDLAEWVPASEQIPAGTVVVLDSTKSNHVISSTRGYDTRVAGVISNQPGIALGERGDSKVLVATTGRVRVKVDARRAQIHIGDLLVTSDVPGVAMKSEPIKVGGRLMHMPGTLIGKALEPLAKGSGTILVLLSLQ